MTCPELLLPPCVHTPAIDLWGIGVLAYELFVGENPFGIWEEDELTFMYNVMAVEASHQTFTRKLEQAGAPEQAIDFVLKLLVQVERRMTAQQAVNHPFITEAADQATPDEEVEDGDTVHPELDIDTGLSDAMR
jgi:hypothetical protein